MELRPRADRLTTTFTAPADSCWHSPLREVLESYRVTQTFPKTSDTSFPIFSSFHTSPVQFKHQLQIVSIWKNDDKIHYDISPSWRLCSQDSKKKKKKALYIFCFTIYIKKRVLLRVTFAFSGTSGEQLPLSFLPSPLSMLGDFMSREL